MKIVKARRSESKITIGLAGPSGSGKTYSALLLAKGMCKDLSKVVVLDTENGSAHLYAHLGPYSILELDDTSPEGYIEAINMVVNEKFEVLLLDSISHVWEHLLQEHGEMKGNSFTNWAKITPRYKAFVSSLLNLPCHVIATMRTKQDYVLNPDPNGKMVPEKVGLKYIQRDGIDYEFSLVLDLDHSHKAVASKDRTGMFADRPPFLIEEQKGRQIIDWCNGANEEQVVLNKIKEASSIKELLSLYSKYKDQFPNLTPMFTKRKEALSQLLLIKTGNGAIVNPENDSHDTQK